MNTWLTLHLVSQNAISTFKDVSGSDQPPSDIKAASCTSFDFWWTLAGLLPRSATSAQHHLLYYLLPCYCLDRFSPSSHSPDKKHKKVIWIRPPSEIPRGCQDISVSALLKLLCCCWSFVLISNKVMQVCQGVCRSASAGVNFDFFDRQRSNDYYSLGP